MAKKNKKSWVLWLDTAVVLLNLSTSYSIIPYLVFRQYDRYTNMIILFVLDILYLLIRFYGNKKKKDKKEEVEKAEAPSHRRVKKGIKASTLLIGLYIAISVMCILAGLLTGTGWKSALIYLSLNVVFFILLKKLYVRYRKRYSVKESVFLLSRGYLILASLSVLSSVLLFLMFKGGFNPYVNQITHRYDLFLDNSIRFDCEYYFPYHLGILDVAPTGVRVPFFQEEGLLTGLYHEPHCQTFMVFPALFLLLFYSKAIWQKWIVGAAYVMIVLLSSSTTNIAALLVTLLVYLFYTFKSSLSKTGILLGIVVLLVLAVRSFVDLSFFDFIFNKVESGSMDYSMSTIDFALHPRTLLGTNFYNLAFVNSGSAANSMDVGFITCLLNIAFLSSVLWCMFRLFKAKSELKLAVLLFAVYFFAHSAKVAMVAYSLTMLVFVFYLVAVISHTPDSVTQ